MRVPREDLAKAIHSQWSALRIWVDSLQLSESDLQRTPTLLPNWQVDQLISHLGLTMAALARLELLDAQVPSTLTLAEYLAAQQRNASDQHQAALSYANGMRGRVQVEVDELGQHALSHLDEVFTQLTEQDQYVSTHHGPLTLRSYLAATLIELVVHSDDLARSFPQAPGTPLDSQALKFAANELLRVVTTRGGWKLQVDQPLLWTRLATGRQTLDVDDLARAISPQYTSDSIPDLGRQLPVL